MLAYDMPLYRPPSEGPNLIIQATIGCSFNRCSFCAMYKTKSYRARPLSDIFADIDQAAKVWPEAHRVFLADGDALVLPTDDLLAICDKLQKTFPNLQRVSAYATPINLNKKTPDELAALRAARLSLVYFGIESGADVILKKITKGATQKTMIEALTKARDAGLKVSATVILGLGGQDYWQDHIQGTADLVNAAPPNYLSTLQLTIEDIVSEEFQQKFKEPFHRQDDKGILAEQEALLAALNPEVPIIFRSNHASNCLALAGNLPKDRDRLLAEINAAKNGAMALRPDFLRGL